MHSGSLPLAGRDQTSTGDPKSPERSAVVTRAAIGEGVIAAEYDQSSSICCLKNFWKHTMRNHAAFKGSRFQEGGHVAPRRGPTPIKPKSLGLDKISQGSETNMIGIDNGFVERQRARGTQDPT
jgi:hypothetical protein